MPRRVEPSPAEHCRGGERLGELRWGNWMGSGDARRDGLEPARQTPPPRDRRREVTSPSSENYSGRSAPRRTKAPAEARPRPWAWDGGGERR